MRKRVNNLVSNVVTLINLTFKIWLSSIRQVEVLPILLETKSGSEYEYRVARGRITSDGQGHSGISKRQTLDPVLYDVTEAAFSWSERSKGNVVRASLVNYLLGVVCCSKCNLAYWLILYFHVLTFQKQNSEPRSIFICRSDALDHASVDVTDWINLELAAPLRI